MKKRNILAILILPFCLSACRAEKALSWGDARADELLALFESPQRDDPYLAAPAPELAKLDQARRERIEKWLRDRRLNRFGDPEGSLYASGTPLFAPDGQAMERFDYLLRKFPDLRRISR
jgi:hypothetical protein